MQIVRLPYNLSSVAQLAAFTAFGDQTFVQTIRGQVRQAREDWERFLTKAGLPHYQSQMNFQFFQAPQKQAAALKEHLLNHDFLVRDGLKPR